MSDNAEFLEKELETSGDEFDSNDESELDDESESGDELDLNEQPSASLLQEGGIASSSGNPFSIFLPSNLGGSLTYTEMVGSFVEDDEDYEENDRSAQLGA